MTGSLFTGVRGIRILRSSLRTFRKSSRVTLFVTLGRRSRTRVGLQSECGREVALPPLGKGAHNKKMTKITKQSGAMATAAGALVAVGLLMLMVVEAGPAGAAFPGKNGRIA